MEGGKLLRAHDFALTSCTFINSSAVPAGMTSAWSLDYQLSGPSASKKRPSHKPTLLPFAPLLSFSCRCWKQLSGYKTRDPHPNVPTKLKVVSMHHWAVTAPWFWARFLEHTCYKRSLMKCQSYMVILRLKSRGSRLLGYFDISV